MAPVVERIETAGPDGRARRIVFLEEEEPRITAAAVVRALGLETGDEVEPADLEACEEKCARERAHRILGHRDRSTAELRSRLENDGYSRSVVMPLVQRLIELELLDDERFAASWARSRAACGVGRSRILTELRSKGIDSEIAGSAVLHAMQEHDPVETVKRLLGGELPKDRRSEQRVIARLLRKGFDIDTIRSAMRRAEEP